MDCQLSKESNGRSFEEEGLKEKKQRNNICKVARKHETGTGNGYYMVIVRMNTIVGQEYIQRQQERDCTRGPQEREPSKFVSGGK